MAEAIRERGYRDCTVADVVRNARTSRRTFYAHFASREDCYIALLRQANTDMASKIAAAVDPRETWETQVRQAIEGWIAAAQSGPVPTLSWIRDVPALGEGARQLQRESQDVFIELVQTLTGTPELRAAGISPPSRPLAIMLLGGLHELIATTVEDGGRISDITELAVQATTVLLSPAR
jgi:AcrR family transcriptional regulator